MRRRAELGACGCFLRILLGVLNIIILGVGIALVILTSLFKWSSVFDFIKNYRGLEKLVDFGTLDGVVIALLIIGIYLVILSIIGFIATISMNRVFLGELYIGKICIV